MKRAQDIKFIINSGDHKGEQYGFTLAEVDGKKAWTSIRLFYPPPSIVKDKIEMAITAREKNVSLSGAVELRLVNKIIEQLNTIFEETTPVTLIGFDKQQYPVLVDKEGPKIMAVMHEKEREPEYLVSLTCWGLYK